MQAGLGRAERDAEGRRHVGQRHPEQVVQRDDGAVPGIEALQGPVDELPVGERAGVVGVRRCVDGRELHLDRAPAPAPGQVEAGMDGQTVEPGVEPVRVAKPRQVAPGADEGLLDRVARELRVPENQAGGRVQPRERRVDERGEGVMIALPRAFDEHSLVHDGLAVPRPGGRVRQRMASVEPNCSIACLVPGRRTGGPSLPDASNRLAPAARVVARRILDPSHAEDTA